MTDSPKTTTAPRAGDHVLHAPSDETWVLGRVDGEHVCPFGWPRSRARLADCSVVKRCTDEEHQTAVADFARVGGF